MSFERISVNFIETDVLVIGGGIGGCCVAAKAADKGLNVVLLEKSKTDRSGSASQGIDHYGAVARDGVTPLQLMRGREGFLRMMNGEGRWVNPNLLYSFYKDGMLPVEELEKLGVTMRWNDGDYYWQPHVGHGGARVELRVHWLNVKPELAKAVRRHGVNVLERTMVADLLENDGVVVGATAVNTRSGEFTVIKAKATVIATGLFARAAEPETPQPWRYKLRYHWCPATVSGDGWAAAYRAGADLASMELNVGSHFIIRDSATITYGCFPNNDAGPSHQITWKGEDIGFLSASKYAELEREGKAPIYHSIEHLNDDYQKRTELTNADERLISLKTAEDRGFNPKTHCYELMPLKALDWMTAPGIYTDEYSRTSLPGLYSVGDCTAGVHGCCQAIAGGFLVADSLTSFVKQTGKPEVDEGQVEIQKQTALAPLSVKKGTPPLELESAIRYIIGQYSGVFKSEGKLREGIRRLSSLRRAFLPQLIAENPHFLMRCLEVRNILDLAELHLHAALERKETRGNHIRVDYPELDPSWNNMVIRQRLADGKPILERREIPELKPEYAKEER